MTWDKPKTGGQWALLFLPAGVCVISTVLGGLVAPKDGDWIAFAVIGLGLAALISFGMSIWLARVNSSMEGKIGCVVVCFIIMMMVNCAVSFAGCATAFATLPAMSFH